jgi:hypothetical protein
MGKNDFGIMNEIFDDEYKIGIDKMCIKNIIIV